MIHGPFVFGIVTMMTLPVIVYATPDLGRRHALRALSIGTCIAALLFVAWTIYAILATLARNNDEPRPTFGSFGFISLIALTALIGALDVWLLVLLVLDV